MKRYLLIVAALLCTSPAWAATYVSSKFCNDPGFPTTTLTCTQTLTAGNTIILFGMGTYNALANNLTFSSSQGDVIVQSIANCNAPSDGGLGANKGAYIVSAVGGSTTFTLTSDNSIYLEIYVVEYSGVGSFIDCNNATSTAGNVTTAAITTGANNALLVGLAWSQGSGALSLNTVSSGYTARRTFAAGLVYAGGWDSLTNTAGSQTFSISLTPTSGTYLGALIMGFNGAAGGGIVKHKARSF